MIRLNENNNDWIKQKPTILNKHSSIESCKFKRDLLHGLAPCAPSSYVHGQNDTIRYQEMNSKGKPWRMGAAAPHSLLQVGLVGKQWY